MVFFFFILIYGSDVVQFSHVLHFGPSAASSSISKTPREREIERKALAKERKKESERARARATEVNALQSIVV